ncbi:MAG TPA: DNA ligase D [Kofleriaceae bacterium]|jgi:bifunctional non-homologous end joining protein LigD|nr:DNA ligase D [Kofleriaceae bacterium]
MPADDDKLDTYRAKRTGGATPEPMASTPGAGRGPRMFVVHQHDATRMHWDLRLEIDGVLCSWAVPKVPSMDPDDKRLAVKVENHPLEYVHFEAVIPDGNYGAGPMIAWDRGMFRPLLDPAQGMLDGEVKFELYGYKLRGAFTLVHTGKGRRGRSSGRGSNDWLLIKKRDEPALQFLAAGQPLSAASVLSGLTIDALAAGAPDHRAVIAELAGLGAPRREIRPDALELMLCHTAEAAFSSDDWVFELKYDGFRMAGFGGAGLAELRYRSGQDPTLRFPELTSALRALPIPGLVLDGELVMLDAEGKPDFHRLATRAQIHRTSEIQRAALTAPVTYMVFDLLGAAGYDLRGLPLLVRKALLARILPAIGPLKLAEHIPAQGEALLAQVVARGLEGVVAKRAASPYRATRSRDWLKLKRDPEADLAVCGYTPPKQSRAGFGALHLCVRQDERWIWAGRVGTGFDDALLTELAAELATRPTWQPTFPRPEGTGDVRWIEPELVVQVRYHGWAEGGSLRFAVFQRLRRDKRAIDCTMIARRTGAGSGQDKGSAEDQDEKHNEEHAEERNEEHAEEHTDEHAEEPPPAPPLEIDAPVRELRLSNLKKLFWKAEGITKGDLIDYYRQIAPYILPYLADRPTVLTRYPDGIDGEMFYQKDMPDWVPPWLRTTALWSEHSQREIHYVLIDDADGLAFIANLGSIPVHAWASRIANLEKPDWTIVDLDPKNAPREHVVPLALAIHALCDAAGLPNYVKTSGQTGLHVLIPLGGQCTFDQARTLAYLIGLLVERQHPTMATTARNPAGRHGRVYLDWGQNAHGQLLVAPYSVRPVGGAPVSMPLTWDEVVPGLDPKQFHLRNALDRVTRWPGDPCAAVLNERPDLAAALDRLEQLAKA